MSLGGWYAEKREAESEYYAKRINHETYERRTRFAIGMIYKCGDEDGARRMARAHGYNIEELIQEVN